MPRKYGPRYRVPFRRRREGRTDYRARYKMVISGKIRAVVRKSLRNIVIHFVRAKLEGDETLVFTKSTELTKYGWRYNRGNVPAAYLTGYLAGLKALKAGIKEAILDGVIKNDYDEAYEFMLKKGAEMGLKPVREKPPLTPPKGEN